MLPFEFLQVENVPNPALRQVLVRVIEESVFLPPSHFRRRPAYKKNKTFNRRWLEFSSRVGGFIKKALFCDTGSGKLSFVIGCLVNEGCGIWTALVRYEKFLLFYLHLKEHFLKYTGCPWNFQKLWSLLEPLRCIFAYR